MAYVPGAVAATVAAITDLSAAHRGRSREVRITRKKRRVCVCMATCTAVARPDDAAAAVALPGPPAHARGSD